MNPKPIKGDLSPLEKAIANVTIDQVWRHLRLRGEPSKNCHSPFRTDHKASFSIYDEGRRWHDFGTGEFGNVVDFIQRATGLPKSAACKWLIRFSQNGNSTPVPPSPSQQSQEERTATESARLPQLPSLRRGTQDELTALSSRRGISIPALELAQERGFLHFTNYYNQDAWVVTDITRRNAQARRLDGGIWYGGSKVQGFADNWGRWPIGIREAVNFPCIALCEGTPDLLAAFELMIREGREDVAPVCITGATHSIHPDGLPQFAGKRVRLFPHSDATHAGLKAAVRWAGQLRQVGAIVDYFSFAEIIRPDEKPVKDLNDFCSLDFADRPEADYLHRILPSVLAPQHSRNLSQV
jgi:hypothetical protein